MGKTNPLNDDDLVEFIDLQKGFSESEKSWTINVDDLNYEEGVKGIVF